MKTIPFILMFAEEGSERGLEIEQKPVYDENDQISYFEFNDKKIPVVEHNIINNGTRTLTEQKENTDSDYHIYNSTTSTFTKKSHPGDSDTDYLPKTLLSTRTATHTYEETTDSDIKRYSNDSHNN